MSSLLCCEGTAYYFWFQDLQVYSALMKGIFNFERRAVLNLFKKTKNKTHLQSAVFVASTSITIIMTSIPTINFGKLENALNFSQMWWRCQLLSFLFNQYLRQSTQTEHPQALSFRRNIFTLGRNEIFPTFTCPIRVDFKFPGRILRCIRNRLFLFAHTMCCIIFFFFFTSLSCLMYLLQWRVHF